jgi:hypothetical protein
MPTFKDQLDEKSLERFNEVAKKNFAEQAQFFLNAFWDEVGDQAEFIYEVAYETLQRADMRWKNVSYVHLYEDGDEVDFDTAIYLFEQIAKFCDEDKNAHWKEKYPRSIPEMKTSITRKKELRDEVDVNFNGRISFIEYLLYQYKVSPKDLMERSKPQAGPVNQALINAKKALDDVNKKIKEYETKRQELLTLADGSGVKSLRAKNELAQLDSSPLAETLRRLLITAEAAVRIAAKQGGSYIGDDNSEAVAPPRTDGEIWWMKKSIAAAKAKYGPKKKN